MAVTGNLNEISMENLIQFNCQVGVASRLKVENGSQVAQIYFSDGNVVHAALGEKEGEEAFYGALGWKSGEFELDRDLTPPARTISSHWSDLLLGGLHQLDESVHEEHPEGTEFPGELLPDDLGAMFGFEKTIEIQKELKEENDMANFHETLRELSHEVPGFVATGVVGMDGLGIAGHADERINLETIYAQMALLFKLVNTTIEKLSSGDVEDFLLTTDRAYLLIRYLTGREYFLGISAERSKANLGNMRLFSRIYADKLSKEMPR